MSPRRLKHDFCKQKQEAADSYSNWKFWALQLAFTWDSLCESREGLVLDRGLPAMHIMALGALMTGLGRCSVYLRWDQAGRLGIDG